MTVLTIAARELKGTFNTTIGWLVLSGFLFLNGVFFAMWTQYYAEASASFSGNPYQAAQMTLSEHLFADFFANTAVLLVFLLPALSMRMFAEERRHHTLELLMTSPVTTAEIVLGKYLGALGFAALLLAGTLYGPALLLWWSTPDLGALAAGYLALLLVSGLVLAIGALFSAMTTNQITALVLTVALTVMLYVVQSVGDGFGWDWLTSVAILPHIHDMLVGAVRLSDLTYFAAGTAFFLFATHQRVEAFRWS